MLDRKFKSKPYRKITIWQKSVNPPTKILEGESHQAIAAPLLSSVTMCANCVCVQLSSAWIPDKVNHQIQCNWFRVT